jgi:hypothetical protein
MRQYSDRVSFTSFIVFFFVGFFVVLCVVFSPGVVFFPLALLSMCRYSRFKPIAFSLSFWLKHVEMSLKNKKKLKTTIFNACSKTDKCKRRRSIAQSE